MLKQLSFCLFLGAITLPAVAQTGKDGMRTMNTNTFTINGTLKNLPYMPAKMYLVYDTINARPVDSTVVKNGKYTFNGKIDQPAMAYLMPTYKSNGKYGMERGDYSAPVFLDQGKITVVSDKKISNTTVTGSTPDKDYRLADKPCVAMWDSIRGLADLYKETQDKAFYDQAFITAGDEIKLEVRTYANFVRNHPASPANPYLIYRMLSYNNAAEMIGFGLVDTLSNMLHRCTPEAQASVIGQAVAAKLEMEARSAPGHKAPDFTQNNSTGEPVSLSSYKGKYVMLLFWSAKSIPFAYDLSAIKKAYENYKDKGLNIIGISLDEDKDLWMKAINSGAGSWEQVFDGKGRSSDVAKLYGVNSEYNNVLIDPNGTIVAKDIHMSQLANTLDAIFN